MKKISIILPIYNTREYLEQCIRSILNQTYKNIELICVDDGSTDGSDEIVRKFAENDGRIKLICQENFGESAARNTGLRAATGDIWTFVDCDDWLDEDMYEILITAMEESDSDISAGSWYEEFETYTNPVKNKLEVKNKTFDNKRLFYYIYRRDEYRAFGYMWNKLYRKECFFDENGDLILFDETMKNGGDIIYLAELVSNSRQVVFVDRPFYHYRQRSTSGSYSKNVRNRMGSIYAYEKVLEIVKQCDVDEKIIGYIKRFIGYHCLLIAQTAIEIGDTNSLQIVKGYMKKYESDYIAYNMDHPERVQLYKSIINSSEKKDNLRYIVFGTGIVGKRVVEQLYQRGTVPITIVDNNKNVWGTQVMGVRVNPPEDILTYDFDRVIVGTFDYYDEVYNQLIGDFGISSGKILPGYCFSYDEFMDYYESNNNLSAEESEVFNFVKETKQLHAINYDYTQEYRFENINVEYDDSCNMYFGLYKGHKLYLPKRFDTIEKVQKYINELLIEQDERSPHRYTDNGFDFDGGTLLDLGAAEGNFSIEFAEKADRIILVEGSEEWRDALEMTFRDYSEKITIIPKYVSDFSDETNITIDDIAKEQQPDFIKFDIEGGEVAALYGAKQLMKDASDLKMAICVYHNQDDEKKITDLVKKSGFNYQVSPGRMVFLCNIHEPCRMVHGVLRCEKRTSK